MTSPPACRPPLSINGEVDWTSACGRYEKFGEVDWTSAFGRCEKIGEVDWTPAAAGVYDMRGGMDICLWCAFKMFYRRVLRRFERVLGSCFRR